ncbi:hypothetical protein CRUP_027641, partial [Coryphaenoides rupestris]
MSLRGAADGRVLVHRGPAAAVTAMLPVCLFPTMGILPSKKVCPQYFLDTNFLFLSGLIMASAIEEWGLHRRIALKVLRSSASKPAWLILGMMLTSSFLSMWLSNTATTAMMLPIANAILESLFGDLETLKRKCRSGEDAEGEILNGPSSMKLQSVPSPPSEKQILSIEGQQEGGDPGVVDGWSVEEVRAEAQYHMLVWKGFLICIPYAASIGGTATLTGTAPNLILIGQLKRLCVRKQDQRAEAEAKAQAVIEDDYRKLGPINFAEASIAFFFVVFALLLFTRDPKFVTGWSVFFPKGYVSDAVTGVIIVSILFFFPSQKPSLSWWFNPQASNDPYVPLLSWKKAQDSVPWNIILLLGGGFAMAKGCEVPPAAAAMFLTAFVACFTEFASNTATIIIFLPVIAELAMGVSVNPLYFMIPATVGCSYAFMLPVSTPPNSIAFASGHLLVKDMVKTGIVMNILGVLCVSLAMNTWGVAMFDLGRYPDWAHPANVSSSLVHTSTGSMTNTSNSFAAVFLFIEKLRSVLSYLWSVYSAPRVVGKRVWTLIALCSAVAMATAGLLYYWLSETLRYDPRGSLKVAGVYGAAVFLLLLLCHPLRCVATVGLLSLFTKQGRRLVVQTSFAVLLFNVVPNIAVNIGAAVHVLKCTSEAFARSLLDSSNILNIAKSDLSCVMSAVAVTLYFTAMTFIVVLDHVVFQVVHVSLPWLLNIPSTSASITLSYKGQQLTDFQRDYSWAFSSDPGLCPAEPSPPAAGPRVLLAAFWLLSYGLVLLEVLARRLRGRVVAAFFRPQADRRAAFL